MSTIGEAADHLFITERRFYELLDQQIVSRMPAGQYDLNVVREQYLTHIRSVAAGRTAEDGIGLSVERARVAKSQADAMEMKNARDRRELLPRTDVHLSVTEAFSRVRAKLLALPSKIAPTIFGLASIAEVRDIVTKAIHEALAELSSTTIAGIPVPAESGSGDAGGGTGLVGSVGTAPGPARKSVGRHGAAAKPRSKR
jgi:phage terminase Nu1 subunit (DNA packaging protein)